MISCLPVQFVGGKLLLLDQRKLPASEVFVECLETKDVHQAIKDMVVRGAPCIGFSGIFGLALAAKNLGDSYSFAGLKGEAEYLKSARPTAVNLAYEIDRALKAAEGAEDSESCAKILATFGEQQLELSEKSNRAMAKFAIEELDKRLGKKSYNILTHCNTGFLACGSVGTALGVVQQLAEDGRINNVWVDETRPYLQGARLTSFELGKLGIPHKIVVEGAASYLMKRGLVDAVFVGADRIAANGDTANKIGTSNLSIIAKEYEVPFYVAAPFSTFDFKTQSGNEIEIELREEEEILSIAGSRLAPAGASALNPSFDVTDSKFISAIVSERGAALPPYKEALEKMFEN